MKKIIHIITLLLLLPPLSAQNDITSFEPSASFTSQSLAFDAKSGIIAVINQVDNEIMMVSPNGDGTLDIARRFPVDQTTGRRDEQHIYRPVSVAICDGYVAFLASHRDSCYFAVLNMNGNLETKLTFQGNASAFSYHQQAHQLYITGENTNGFNLMVLDTRNGINRVDMKDVSMLLHPGQHAPEKIAGHNAQENRMPAMVIFVVLAVLLILYLFLKRLGKKQMEMLERRTQERKEKRIVPRQEAVVSPVALNDGVYAAIAAAIHLYGEELHDVENTVLTINKVSRSYSPWSSKIHGLNTYFKR